MENKVIQLLCEELASAEETRISDPKCDYDYAIWGTINCQRTEDGSWKIWFVMSEVGRLHEPVAVWEASKIRDAQHFIAEFSRCGVDYGSNPDLGALLEMLPAIADEDALLASELRLLLNESN